MSAEYLECPMCGWPAFERAEPVWQEDEEERHRCGYLLRCYLDVDGDEGDVWCDVVDEPSPRTPEPTR